MDIIEQYRAPIEAELSKIEILNKIEKTIKVPKFFLFLGVVGLAFFLVFANIGASLVANIVGFIYPSYASFKALESPGDEDDKLWLTYWVVYAFFNIIEYFSGWLLAWFPFYFIGKLIFLIFLMHPTAKGALVVYERILRPILTKYEKEIDSKMNEYSETAKKVATDSGKKIVQEAAKNPEVLMAGARFAADLSAEKKSD